MVCKANCKSMGECSNGGFKCAKDKPEPTEYQANFPEKLQLVSADPEKILSLIAHEFPFASEAKVKDLASHLIAGINSGELARPFVPRARGVEAYPLRSHLWHRNSTNEWVLQVEGTINDVAFTAQHTAPGTMAPEDVAGLPHLYPEE